MAGNLNSASTNPSVLVFSCKGKTSLGALPVWLGGVFSGISNITHIKRCLVPKVSVTVTFTLQVWSFLHEEKANKANMVKTMVPRNNLLCKKFFIGYFTVKLH
jgi:hypothetical protein